MYSPIMRHIGKKAKYLCFGAAFWLFWVAKPPIQTTFDVWMSTMTLILILILVVAPLLHGVAQSQDLALKSRAGGANAHVDAQGQLFSQTQGAVFASDDQGGYLFAGALEGNHAERAPENQLSAKHSRKRRRAR
jgi:hypothetical protein